MEQDLAMILDPDKWSQWPVLPMVRRDGSDVGLLFDQGLGAPNVQPRVYLANIFAPIPLGCKTQDYLDYSALVADWRVD